MVRKVLGIAEEAREELIELSEFILDNPELGYQEYKAAKAHVELLRKYGFSVEEGYLGMETAFKAVYDSGIPGPSIAYLSEYDALPGVGHGCGHNILGATNTGAGIVLSKLIGQHKGRVVVFGTPAEETSGAKVDMVDKGAFDDVDVAIEVHPSDKHYMSGSSLALQAIQFTYKGRTAHAAADPEHGINALDAAINTFNNINALREHILSSARIHGIIKEGGRAANVVPDLAITQFYVRATTKTYLEKLVERVKNCARGAALAAGAELEISNYEMPYDNLVTNKALSAVYEKWLREVGVKDIEGPRKTLGSSDIGNVSQVVPAIHPYFGICQTETPGHSKEFAQATRTPYAYDSMVKTMTAMVLTAIEIIDNEDLLKEIRREFENAEK
jgi:amidohydrolase